MIRSPPRNGQAVLYCDQQVDKCWDISMEFWMFSVSPIHDPPDIYDMWTISNMPGQRQEDGNTIALEPTCDSSLSCELCHNTPNLDTIPATDTHFG